MQIFLRFLSENSSSYAHFGNVYAYILKNKREFFTWWRTISGNVSRCFIFFLFSLNKIYKRLLKAIFPILFPIAGQSYHILCCLHILFNCKSNQVELNILKILNIRTLFERIIVFPLRLLHKTVVNNPERGRLPI